MPFQSHEREAFNGLALVIVRARKGATGRITVTVIGDGLKQGADGDHFVASEIAKLNGPAQDQASRGRLEQGKLLHACLSRL